MGVDIKLPESGAACTVCWGIGKPFGSGATPKWIHAIVSGVIRNAGNPPTWPPAPNGTFHLLQTGVCRLSVVSGLWTYNLYWDNLYSDFNIWWGITLAAFSDTPATKCVVAFTNDYVNPGMAYYGGTVQIIV
jgi:hypothetical protein